MQVTDEVTKKYHTPLSAQMKATQNQHQLKLNCCPLTFYPANPQQFMSLKYGYKDTAQKHVKNFDTVVSDAQCSPDFLQI